MTKRIDSIRQKVSDAQEEAERELKTPEGDDVGLSLRVRTEGGSGIDLKKADGEPFYLDEKQWDALGKAISWLEADV